MKGMMATVGMPVFSCSHDFHCPPPSHPSASINPARHPRSGEGCHPQRATNEAAAFLNVSKALLYKLTMTRKIPFYKVGSRTMFSEEQLLTWVKSFEHLLEEPSPRSTRSN
jgi:excisionase family DNA binding protein